MMNDLEIAEILTQARNLMVQAGITRYRMHDSSGFCSVGAIRHVTQRYGPVCDRYAEIIVGRVGGWFPRMSSQVITTFNDSSTNAQILEMFDYAINVLKPASTVVMSLPVLNLAAIVASLPGVPA